MNLDIPINLTKDRITMLTNFRRMEMVPFNYSIVRTIRAELLQEIIPVIRLYHHR
jgi:hypothetical protein